MWPRLTRSAHLLARALNAAHLTRPRICASRFLTHPADSFQSHDQGSTSAEAGFNYKVKGAVKPADVAVIEKAVSTNFLLSHLNGTQRKEVFSSMEVRGNACTQVPWLLGCGASICRM